MKKLILMIFFLASSYYVYAQGFNGITSPDGIHVAAVGNSGLIYRSLNGGVTWISTPHGVNNFYSVTSSGNDVWISGQNGNVYKTLKSNSPVTSYFTGVSVNLYGITFINSNTGFVCGDAGNVFKSVNGGVNWTLSNIGIASVKLNSISFSDANYGTVVGNNGTIYKTTDGGASWTLQSSGTVRNLLKVKQLSDSTVAVGEYGTILQNNGSGWFSIASRTVSDIKGVTGTNMSDVHLCGGGGFIRNNRNGKSNFYNFEMNPMMANLTDIFYYDYDKGFAVSSLNKVIIYTSNAGASWKMMNGASISYNWINKITPGSGIGNNLCRHPNNRDAFFVAYGNKVYRSGNRGDSWTQIATITGTGFTSGRAHSFYVSPIDTNILIAAIDNVTPDKVVRSTNYGANWSMVIEYNFSSYGQPLEMDQNNPSTYYFAPDGSSTGFFKSTDNGASFSSVSNSNPFTSPCDIIVMWDSSNVLYVGDDGADIFKSTNGGVNWTLVKPTSSSEVPSMCNSVFDKSLCYATTWGSNQVFRTLNFGDSWSVISNNSGSGWGSDLCHEDPNLILTGNYGAQSYLTTNGGANFFNVDNGLAGAGAGIMVPERGLMFNMQTSSLFKLNITYTDSVVTSNVDVQPTSIGLSGNQYFESATIIPEGIVKNNNGAESATFTVTRKITPGNYVSTKTITDLLPGLTTNVNFDLWTFNSGTSYTVKDSVYIFNDNNTANDVITGSLTPIVGYSSGITEDFSGSFPPKNWNLDYTGTLYWTYNTASSYGTGVGSAKFDYYTASPGTVQSLITSTFSPTVSGDSLSFDNAYAPYSPTFYDSLFIETSSDGGASYTTIVKMYGFTGATGTNALNTREQLGSAYNTPASNEWLSRKYSVPAGTNKIRFRARSGYGNNLYIDKISLSTGALYTQFNVKAVPEGLLDGNAKVIRDTVTVYLRNISSPYAIVDSSTVVIDSVTLTAPCVFRNAASGTYYLHVKHRNALETWSKSGGESFTSGLKGNYDFTSSQSQTYGNNSVLVGSKYCMYSGDVNTDGVIDGSDISIIDNDATNFSTGYIVTDLNGDFIIDGSDLLLADNNASNFVTKNTPETIVFDKSLKNKKTE